MEAGLAAIPGGMSAPPTPCPSPPLCPPACPCLPQPRSPFLPPVQGSCTTLGGLCILDAKQLGRILHGAGPWVKLTLVNVRLVNGNSRDTCEPERAGRLVLCAAVHACASCLPGSAAGGLLAGGLAGWGLLPAVPPMPACMRSSSSVQAALPRCASPRPACCAALLHPHPAPALPVPDHPAHPAAAGGAILLEEGASLSLTNCAFERNWARDGGAIDVKVRERQLLGSGSWGAAAGQRLFAGGSLEVGRGCFPHYLPAPLLQLASTSCPANLLWCLPVWPAGLLLPSSLPCCPALPHLLLAACPLSPCLQNGSEISIVGTTFNNNKAGVTGGAMRAQVGVGGLHLYTPASLHQPPLACPC